MIPVGGHSYYVGPLQLTAPSLFEIRADTNEEPLVSGLVLTEDGRPFGTAHSQHADIVAIGSGAYSHWGEGLYLSSSDNSDPRSNRRAYVARVPLSLRQDVMVAIALALALLAAGAIHASAPWLRQLFARSREGVVAGAHAIPVANLSATLGTVVVGGLLYASMINPINAMLAARRAAVWIAMSGCWFAAGILTGAYVLRPSIKSWRVLVAVMTLAMTAWLLALRPDVYFGYGLLPPAANVLIPLGAGAFTAFAARAWWGHSFHIDSLVAPHASSRALWAAVVIGLCLAAPMIWSPVVEAWNTSGWMDSHSYDAYAHNILSGKRLAGNSNYMPVYQYGLAAVYYIFGHFFFAQQLVNVALAFVTALLLGLSAWNLFRNAWAVLFMGVWVAFVRQMVYAVHFTQIESWYMPIVAFGIFAWTCYWRSPSKSHLLLIAFAAALGINTRSQGAFYFGWLCLAPLFIATLPLRRRLAHAAMACALLAASLVPWTVRNYVVEGRLSPAAARNAYYFAILNDPRVGFYGIRYWEGWGDISREYDRKYPDPVERDREMMRAGLSAPFTHFDWFKRAVFWRSLGFYGLLPNGVLVPDRIEPTNWAAELDGYVYWRTTQLVLLPLSLIGLLVRPGRMTAFLAIAIAANVVPVMLTAATEDRVSYPVLPLHMLMALAAIFAPRSENSSWRFSKAMATVVPGRTLAAVGICALLSLIGARLAFGRPNMYAPLVERNLFVQPAVSVDTSAPSLNEYAGSSMPSPAVDRTWEGQKVRLRFIALNYQCPPKWGGRIGYMPEFTTDPERETYYSAYLLVRRGSDWNRVPIGVTWFGATVNEGLREGDEVDAEGELLAAPPNMIATYWVRIAKARKVVHRSTEIPAFQ